MTLLPLLALLGAIIAAVVGTFWYSPGTPMGKLNMRSLGLDKLTKEEMDKMMNDLKPHMWKSYSLQMVLSLLTSFAVVFIITMSVENGVPFFMALGFVLMNWLCFMVPVVGGSILWGNVDRAIAWKKFFSDIFCHLTILVLVALMTSLFV